MLDKGVSELTIFTKSDLLWPAIMESHIKDRTDEHSQCCVNANQDDVATDSTDALNDVENGCIIEESSDDEMYYVLCDYKAAEDNQVYLDTPLMA